MALYVKQEFLRKDIDMYFINKISTASPVDFAAEELKKYLRMMMPECGDVEIKYNPMAKDGFRLGLMQDFELDVSDAEDTTLDDILYIDCDEEGGIIAGDNPRAVLLAVYEYLRQNGCRWLFPGVDGELIPIKNIFSVKYRHKPSCRFRGLCNEGAEFQRCMIESIDFIPKVGMNVYMMEFQIPSPYYDLYYNHNYNRENLAPEPVSPTQVLQWKRQCESEIARRGLQFHDIGHGFTIDPFGIDSKSGWNTCEDSLISEESRNCLAMIDGKRGLYGGVPINTNFCMSNREARKKVCGYVADYAASHSNSDYLHVWLADGANNHCECAECQKKRPSDWYVILLNEIDELLSARDISTKIVFIAYVDTTWRPLEEKIKNPKRFALLLAPITRSYTKSLNEDAISKCQTAPYVRNKLTLPGSLEEYFAHFEGWKQDWKGTSLTYEYHFWRHQCFDVSGFEIAKLINEDIKAYKKQDVNGVIEDGSQRSFFPTGLAFYTYARTLYDTSLSFETIVEEYLSAAFGDDWKLFAEYLKSFNEIIPFAYFSADEARKRESVYLSPERAEKIKHIREITKKAKEELISTHYNSDYRVRTLSARMLLHHADFMDMLSDALYEKAVGNDEGAVELYHKFRIEFGKTEPRIEQYFDAFLYMGSYNDAFLLTRGDRGFNFIVT